MCKLTGLKTSTMIKKQSLRLAFCLIIAGLSACTSVTVDPEGSGQSTVSYPDIAVPPRTFILLKESLAVGEGARWTGRLVAQSESSVTDASTYILKQMQSKGWKLLTSIHADQTTFTFVQSKKIMQIDVNAAGSLSQGSRLEYKSSYTDLF